MLLNTVSSDSGYTDFDPHTPTANPLGFQWAHKLEPLIVGIVNCNNSYKNFLAVLSYGLVRCSSCLSILLNEN